MSKNTLMSHDTFNKLAALRTKLNQVPEIAGKLANVMVPWCGAELKRSGGLYFVGISYTSDGAENESWSYEDCLSQSEELSQMKKTTPFWTTVNKLSTGMFGRPYFEVSEKIGYSNLFKIHMTTHSRPEKWHPATFSEQKSLCIDALQEELLTLRSSLIYIGSDDGYGIFPNAATPSLQAFTEEGPERNWTRWAWLEETRCLFVWAYHPMNVRGRSGTGGGEQKQIDFTLELWSRHLAGAR